MGIVQMIKKTYRMAGGRQSKVVLSNVASLSWLQAIGYIVPLLILPYLFRVIGPSKFGLLAFAQAFVQYFMILTDYGFAVTATKEISLNRASKAKVSRIFWSVITIKIVLLILCMGGMALLLSLVPKFREDWIVYALCFGTVVGSSLFPMWFFQGMEQMKYIAIINIVGEICWACGILYFVRGPMDFLMVPVITSSVAIMTAIMAQYLVFRKFGLKFHIPRPRQLWHELNAGWNVFISAVAINAYTTTRVFAVGLLTNNTMTGFYSIAEKIANVVQTFPLSSFSQALFPRLSKIYQKNKVKAYTLMEQIQTITVNISLICIPAIFVLAPWIVKIVCGGNYSETVLSLRFLLVSVFFISSNAFRVQFLLVSGHTQTYSKIHICMAIIGLPLIIALIYAFSYAGAAMATIAIEVGTFTLTYFAVKKLGDSALFPNGKMHRK